MAGGGDLKSAALMFNWVEYSVFSTMLVLSLLIGVYYGWVKKQDTVAEYMLGGKKMAIFPVTMSLVFSHISGVTLLGIPAEIYSYGIQYCSIFVAFIAVQFIIIYIYLPVFYNLQLNSVYEYLELRFSKGTRTLASFIFALSLVIYIPIVIYIPALAFNEVTGVSIHLISPIISLVCIFYTSFGGLKAVVWTDALQSVFTFGSVIFIIILGVSEFDNLSDIIKINIDGKRIEHINFHISPFERNTFWSMSLGSTIFWLAQLAVHPGAVQRFIAVSTFKEAKRVMWFSTLGFYVVITSVVIVGLLLFATYHDCDPLASNMVDKTGQILPLYVMRVAKGYPGLTGLFISGVVSAALSTMSAGLNTVSGTIYEDFVQFVLKGKKQTDMKQNLTIKIIVLVLGLFCAFLVFIVEKLGALFQMAISLISITNGTLVGVFTLGLFFPRANAKGALAGCIFSLAGVAYMVGGAQYYILQGLLKFPGKTTSIDGCPPNITTDLPFNATTKLQSFAGLGSPLVADPSVPLVFQTSYQYYTMVGTLLALVVGLAVSYLTEPPPPRCLDPSLFTPCVRRLLPRRDHYAMVNTRPDPTEIKTIINPF